MSSRIFSVRYLLSLVALVFFGSIIWSMGYETLLPLLRNEQWLAFLANLLGLPIILAGTAIMLWGFWVFLRDVGGGGNGQTLQPPTRQMSREQRKATQQEALARMKPGLFRLVGGMLLIAIGGFIGTLG